MDDNFDYNAFISAYDKRMKKLTDMVEQQAGWQPQETAYDQHTYAVKSPSPTRQNPYAPVGTRPSSQSIERIEIERLTEENGKLKKQYGELVKKANSLVEAYRNLKTENDGLTVKKAKVDAKAKTVADTKKVFTDMGQKFMTWLKS